MLYLSEAFLIIKTKEKQTCFFILCSALFFHHDIFEHFLMTFEIGALEDGNFVWMNQLFFTIPQIKYYLYLLNISQYGGLKSTFIEIFPNAAAPKAFCDNSAESEDFF